MTLSARDRKYLDDIGIRVEDEPLQLLDDRPRSNTAGFLAGVVLWLVLVALTGGTVWAMLAVFVWGGNFLPTR